MQGSAAPSSIHDSTAVEFRKLRHVDNEDCIIAWRRRHCEGRGWENTQVPPSQATKNQLAKAQHTQSVWGLPGAQHTNTQESVQGTEAGPSPQQQRAAADSNAAHA